MTSLTTSPSSVRVTRDAVAPGEAESTSTTCPSTNDTAARSSTVSSNTDTPTSPAAKTRLPSTTWTTAAAFGPSTTRVSEVSTSSAVRALRTTSPARCCAG